MAIKAVLFDAAGTLIKTARSVGESYATLAKKHGVEVRPAELAPRFRASFDRFAPLAFPAAEAANVPALERAWWKRVVQEVFAQAWRQAARYDASRGAVGAWLLVMARTRAIDKLRAARARSSAQRVESQNAVEDVPDQVRDAATEMIDAEQAERVRRALHGLPFVQRLALELAYYEGLTQREIAERLEEPLACVREDPHQPANRRCVARHWREMTRCRGRR